MRNCLDFKKIMSLGVMIVLSTLGSAQGEDYNSMDFGSGIDSGADAGGGDPFGGGAGDAGGMEPYGIGTGDAGGADPMGIGTENPYGAAAEGVDPFGAGASDAGGTDPFGAEGGDPFGAAQGFAPGPEQQNAPMAPQINTAAVDATLKIYFDKIEDDLLLGDIESLKNTCQMQQGAGCAAAKNFLSACTLFLKKSSSYGSSPCVQQGAQKYKLNSESLTYAANPQKLKEEESAVDHLVGQMTGAKKKLTLDKERFLKVVCTQDSLEMIDDSKDRGDMTEACLKFKGKPAKKGKHRKKLPITIFGDKESPEDEAAPVHSKKASKKHTAKAHDEGTDSAVNPEGSAPVSGESAPGAAQAEEGQAQPNAAPMPVVQEAPSVPFVDNSSPGFGPATPPAGGFDLGKALQSNQGLIQQFDSSGKGQAFMQGLQGVQGNLAGGGGLPGGLGGMGSSEADFGGEAGGGMEDSSGGGGDEYAQ